MKKIPPSEGDGGGKRDRGNGQDQSMRRKKELSDTI